MKSLQSFLLQFFILFTFHASTGSAQHPPLVAALRAAGAEEFAAYYERFPADHLATVPGAVIYAGSNDAVRKYLAENPQVESPGNYSRKMTKRVDALGNPDDQIWIPNTSEERRRKSKRAPLEIPQQGLVFETADKGTDNAKVLKRSTNESQQGRVFAGDGDISTVLVDAGTYEVPGGTGQIYITDKFFAVTEEVSQSISNPENEIGYLEEVFSRLPEASQRISSTAALTLFAPKESAFNASGLNAVTSTDEELQAFLDYHTIVDSACFIGYTPSYRNGSSYRTQSGRSIVATWDGVDTFFINDARIVSPDHIVENGVIQILDKVLTAPADNATTVAGPHGPLPLGEDSTTCNSPLPTQGPNGATATAIRNQWLSGLGLIIALTGLNMF